MADESDVFQKLSQDLSVEERNDLLQRLKEQGATDGDLLVGMESEEAARDSINTHYSSMGVLHRFFLLIKSFFVHREIHDLLEEEIIEGIGRRISRDRPDIFQHRSGELGVGFFKALQSLSSKLSVLARPLKYAFEGDRRAFLAFLASVVLPEETSALSDAVDPDLLSSEERQNEFELKKTVQMATRDALTRIHKQEGRELYSVYRELYFLHQLVFLPVLKPGGDAVTASAGVPASRYRKELSDLCDIAVSIGVRPSSGAVRAVLLFYSSAEPEGADSGESLSPEELEEVSAQSDMAIRELQQFFRNVKLLDLVKVLNRNPEYVPDVLGGGEDWYFYFRQYWEERAEKSLESYLYHRKLDSFRQESEVLLGDGELRDLAHYHNRAADATVRVRYAESGRFVALLGEVFFVRRLVRLLRTLLVSGEFYRQQNREELTDSLKGFSTIGEAVRAIDALLSPAGEAGQALETIGAELVQDHTRARRMQDVVARLDLSMEEVIHRAMEYLESMINVIKGVIHGESDGAYDTLVNKGQIAGVENSSFLGKLDGALTELNTARRLLHQIYDLEKNTDSA